MLQMAICIFGSEIFTQRLDSNLLVKTKILEVEILVFLSLNTKKL